MMSCNSSKKSCSSPTQDTANIKETLAPDFLEKNQSLREALTAVGTPTTTAIANKLAEFDDLIAQYGYEYTSREALTSYHQIVDYVDSVSQNLTVKELNLLEDYL